MESRALEYYGRRKEHSGYFALALGTNLERLIGNLLNCFKLVLARLALINVSRHYITSKRGIAIVQAQL